jgi:ketosteroid isomerase-like protein
MRTPGPSDRAVTVERFLHHLGRRDFEEVLELLSPTVTYKVPGAHALAGVFSGREAVARHLLDIAERTEGHFDPFKQDDVMVGLSHTAVLVSVRMQRRASTLRTRLLILLGFDVSDRIEAVSVFFDDVEAFERFAPRRSPPR